MPKFVETVPFTDMPVELSGIGAEPVAVDSEHSASGDCVSTLSEEAIDGGAVRLEDLPAAVKSRYSAAGECVVTLSKSTIDGNRMVSQLDIGSGAVLGGGTVIAPVPVEV